MDQFDIYLASASPRRHELLQRIGVRFRQLAVEVPEVPQPGEAPPMFAIRMALEKARAGACRTERDPALPVLGADTVVAVEEAILGKPRDRDDALQMLARLSGREHKVYTGVALVGEEEQTRLSVSSVAFRDILPAEAEAYWDSGEPSDKAGAYAIQGLGAIFIERMEGSCSGVMGLPLFETAELLTHFGIQVTSDK